MSHWKRATEVNSKTRISQNILIHMRSETLEWFGHVWRSGNDILKSKTCINRANK